MKVTRFHHVSVNCIDTPLSDMVSFYGDLFGLDSKDRPDIPGVVRPCPDWQSRRRFRRSLGRIAARLPQIGGGAVAHAAGQARAMRPATLARLYDRKKFGSVRVRTA